MKNDHPYQEFQKHPLWKVLNRGIKDLQANGDLEEKTAREYIVGFLSKLLLESDLIAEVPGRSSPRPVKPLNRT